VGLRKEKLTRRRSPKTDEVQTNKRLDKVVTPSLPRSIKKSAGSSKEEGRHRSLDGYENGRPTANTGVDGGHGNFGGWTEKVGERLNHLSSPTGNRYRTGSKIKKGSDFNEDPDGRAGKQLPRNGEVNFK